MNSLSLPMAFGMDVRKPTGYRAAPHRHAVLVDEARRRRWSLQAFLDWCLDQALDLEFLDQDSRDQVLQIARDAGAPYSPLDVIAGLVRAALREVRAGKVVPGVRAGQSLSLKLFGAR